MGSRRETKRERVRERSEKECVWESGSEAGHRCVIGKATEINKILRAIYVNEKEERQSEGERDTQSVSSVHVCVCVPVYACAAILFFFCN